MAEKRKGMSNHKNSWLYLYVDIDPVTLKLLTLLEQVNHALVSFFVNLIEFETLKIYLEADVFEKRMKLLRCVIMDRRQT